MCGTFKMESGSKMVWSKKKDFHSGEAELSRLKGTLNVRWRQNIQLFIQMQVCSNGQEQKYMGNMCLSQNANNQQVDFIKYNFDEKFDEKL